MTTIHTRVARAVRPHMTSRALKSAALAATIATAALLLFVTQVRSLTPMDTPMTVPWWLIAGLSAAADIFIINLQLRRDSYSTSLSEVPLIVGLVFCTPVGLVAGRVLGS